jgi:RNA polymerase sigma-70 factor, ECF subfamily
MKSNQRNYDENEELLVRTAQHGDLVAFNQLVLKYQNRAYYHAYAVLGDHDLAEDATQASFIKAFNAMNAFRGGSFRSWLLTIVTNSALDILRRHHRHHLEPLFPEDENGQKTDSPYWIIDTTSSVQKIVEQNELSRDIYRMLDELPDVYRSVLTLIDLYEFDYAEAAGALKIPIGTVKSRLARARFQMRKKLTSIPMNEEFSISASKSLAM